MTNEQQPKQGILAKLARRLLFIKPAESLSTIPTLDQLDEAAKGLIAHSAQDPALRNSLLYFAGKGTDGGEKFSSHVDREHERVIIIAEDDPTVVVIDLGIGESKESPLYLINKGAIPDVMIFRTRPVSGITGKEALGASLRSLVMDEVTKEERLDLSKRALNINNLTPSTPSEARPTDWLKRDRPAPAPKKK